MSRFLFLSDLHARPSRRELSGALSCEWAVAAAVGKGPSLEAPGSWAATLSSPVGLGAVCVCFGTRDATRGLTCRSQACRVVTWMPALFLQPPAGLADIKAPGLGKALSTP